MSDLHRWAEVSKASNERYLDPLAAANVDESLKEPVGDICKRTRKDRKSDRAINPWNPEDFQTLQDLAGGEHQLNGFVNKGLCEKIYGKAKNAAEQKRLSAKTSRRLRLLRAHGLLRKVPRANRYQLTDKGRRVAAAVVAAVVAASAATTEQLMKIAA